MSSLKILVAAVAAATFSLAFAQGTPPRPATDPAVGAGQRSTLNTPMGMTGTPEGAGMARGTMGASAGTMGAETRSGARVMGSGRHHHHHVVHHRHHRHHHVRKAARN